MRLQAVLYVRGGFRGGILIPPRPFKWSCSADSFRASPGGLLRPQAILYVKGGFRAGILIPPRPSGARGSRYAAMISCWFAAAIVKAPTDVVTCMVT